MNFKFYPCHCSEMRAKSDTRMTAISREATSLKALVNPLNVTPATPFCPVDEQDKFQQNSLKIGLRDCRGEAMLGKHRRGSEPCSLSTLRCARWALALA